MSELDEVVESIDRLLGKNKDTLGIKTVSLLCRCKSLLLGQNPAEKKEVGDIINLTDRGGRASAGDVDYPPGYWKNFHGPLTKKGVIK